MGVIVGGEARLVMAVTLVEATRERVTLEATAREEGDIEASA